MPGKNLRLLGRKPLIAWTIEAALCAGSLDQVLVSTEDNEIGRVAQMWGAQVLPRPGFLATDTASSYDVVRHALKCGKADAVMLLQPTSPFRTADDIDDISDTFELCPLQSVALGETKANGALYLASAGWWRRRTFTFDTDVAVRYRYMPPERSLDIDTEEDFAKAEAVVASWSA